MIRVIFRRPAAPHRSALPSLVVLLVAALAVAAPVAAAQAPEPSAVTGPPALWPDAQRTFLLDGPGWLLSAEEQEALLAMDEAERAAFVEAFAERADGLAEAIELRRDLMRSEYLSPLDVRARLLFLHGVPTARVVVDCGLAFRPIEIWDYRLHPQAEPMRLVLYESEPGRPWRLWTPFDGKRVLYTSEMEYFLEQIEALGARVRARRFDVQACPEKAFEVDDATGVVKLHGYRPDRPTAGEILAWLEPPDDLAAWARRVAALAEISPPPPPPPPLAVGDLDVVFPARQGQRLVARLLVPLEDLTGLAWVPSSTLPDEDEAARELRLVVTGEVSQAGQPFDDFRVRFLVPEEGDERRVVLSIEEPLRPREEFVVRLKVEDEVSGATAWTSTGFRVPAEPEEVASPLTDDALVVLGQDVARQGVGGVDSLLLVPPAEDVVVGLWRAEALVSGPRIVRVEFSVDGKPQIRDGRPPYSVELRLAEYPRQQVVRAEGLDAAGEVVAADEVVLNQPRGALQVRITQPPRGEPVSGRIEAVAEVTVPEERRVEEVVFSVDGEVVARLTSPPWRAPIDVPAAAGSDELSYLAVRATLDDGLSAEDVRMLNVPDYLEEVEVDLVELYATVVDRSGRPVEGLAADDFRVLQEGQPRPIQKFELVRDLPLTVGFAIDTSGSMATSLAEAQEAARQFLRNVVTPRDRAFAVGFADRPVLLMAPTADADAVAESLDDLRSVGWTTLHDAVVTSLYYFRGFSGQRALVVLSDGDDTRSSYSFQAALEFARRSGVSIYTVGLDVGGLSGARRKLTALAEETGGRSFFISKAAELADVYEEIERELRSRYLLAFVPAPGTGDEFQEVEVEVDGSGLEVRAARGFYR